MEQFLISQPGAGKSGYGSTLRSEPLSSLVAMRTGLTIPREPKLCIAMISIPGQQSQPGVAIERFDQTRIGDTGLLNVDTELPN
jgi:hypothetical protein